MKKLTISIPEPCHEDWSKMTPVEQGRHCDVCSKNVVDFTTFSDEAIYKYFNKYDNLCGRFNSSQLDRSIALQRKETPNYLSYAFSGLLSLSLLTTTKTNAAPDLQGSPVIHVQQNTIKGIVIDAFGNHLSDVIIEVKSSGVTTKTDHTGYYVIEAKLGDILEFSSNPFEKKSVTVDQRKTYNIMLKSKKVGP
ncbi:MAG: hypothetical protein HRT68_15890, partial [Flavobacteriaceae bacterium]|nr:hypothetical protein [Flavobacteriaceae bacterium]